MIKGLSHCHFHSPCANWFRSAERAGQRPIHKPAQGKRGTSAALGPMHKSKLEPQRGGTNADAPDDGSVPNIPFINLHPMFPAKRTELILKRPSPVMLLLGRDISADCIDIRFTNGERAVSALPEEVVV